jgi:hypothetical protein
MVGTTSLPELSTNLFAVLQAQRSPAVGILFGTCLVILVFLTVADLFTRQGGVLERVDPNQMLVSRLGMTHRTIAPARAVAHLDFAVIGVDWSTLVMTSGYPFGIWQLHRGRGELSFEIATETAVHHARAPSPRSEIASFRHLT